MPGRKSLVSVVFLGFAVMGAHDCGDEEEAVFETTLVLQDQVGNPATTFIPGQPITFVLSVENLTSSPRTLTTPSHQFYFIITRTDGTTVFDSRYGVIIPAVVTYIDFQRNETKTVLQTWDQVDNASTHLPVVPGVFLAQGYVGASENLRNLRSEWAPFSIQ